MITIYPIDTSITYKDSPNIDAFSRLRVSHPFGIYDYKQISNNLSSQFSEVTAGGGSTAYQYDRSSTYLNVGTASGDRALRQTERYIPYVPGKSQLITLTGVFGAGKANVDQYIGYGDDLNGLFFKLQGTTLGLVLRSAATGSAVDTFIPQSSWNVDKLDGTGSSGKTIDLTKAQIFSIDFQWLGVGRIRYYLDIDGELILAHEINNANSISSVYMKTATLPVRYEIINTGVSGSSTTLEQICSSVSSEGGYELPGLEFSVSNGTTRRAVTTKSTILAIRLKSAFPAGEPNRKTIKLLGIGASATTNDALIELAHVHAPSSITATWTSVSNDSAVEFSNDITAVTGNPSHSVFITDAIAGLGAASGRVDKSSEFVNIHSFVSQNFDSTNSEMFVVYATSYSGTSNVSASVDFIEFG